MPPTTLPSLTHLPPCSLVLDALTAQPGNDALLGLLPAFSAAACAQVLGFHFYRCREDTAAQPPRSARPAPDGLYVAAAKIVRAGYCSLEALWAHLAPSDEDLAAGALPGAAWGRRGWRCGRLGWCLRQTVQPAPACRPC